MSKPYSPLGSLSALRKEMQREIGKHELVIPGAQVAAPLYTVDTKAQPCVVLMKMLLEDGPVPDDFHGIKSATAIREHVRSDGAVFRGMFEIQGVPQSGVIVYADPSTPDDMLLGIAMMERAALERRYADWKLGPFASRPAAPPPPHSPR